MNGLLTTEYLRSIGIAEDRIEVFSSCLGGFLTFKENTENPFSIEAEALRKNIVSAKKEARSFQKEEYEELQKQIESLRRWMRSLSEQQIEIHDSRKKIIEKAEKAHAEKVRELFLNPETPANIRKLQPVVTSEDCISVRRKMVSRADFVNLHSANDFSTGGRKRHRRMSKC